MRSKIFLYPDVIILPEFQRMTNEISCLARIFMDAFRINKSRAVLAKNLPEVTNSSQSSSDYEIFPFSLSPRLKLKWFCLINGATQRHLTIDFITSPDFIIQNLTLSVRDPSQSLTFHCGVCAKGFTQLVKYWQIV